MSELRKRAVAAVALALGLLILYTAAAGSFGSLVQRPVFLAFIVVLGLLHHPLGAGRRWRPLGLAVDVALGASAVASCAWVAWNADVIMNSLPEAAEPEMAMAAVLVVAILELSRRAIGLVFPSMVLLGLLYAFFGSHVPGRLGHRGFDLNFITETLLLSDIGLWGALLGVASTVIAIFALFGSFLLHSGGGQSFMNMALKASGRSVGGGAKIATVASGIFGMVSGSAVGNVATTGSFTIPLMKRLGYPPALAGAVEAVASTGGQIAPPIMGAAAFIMAEIIATDYVTIALAAVLPALLFYAGVFGTVHVIAKKNGLGQVPEDQIPPWSAVLRRDHLAPIVLAFAGLAFGILTGRSIQLSALLGIAGTLAGMAVGRVGPRRPDTAPAAQAVRTALDQGSNSLVVVGILLAGAQILVSMISMTGIGVTLSTMIVDGAAASILGVGVIVALVCMVMGMGIPTTAAYVLVAATLAPALVQAGVAPLAAHMFVFYFATLSVITPPVCVAVFVAAGIANTGWMSVARQAVRLGAVTYVIPFLFLLYPGMLAPSLDLAYAEAIVSGLVFVTATAHLFGGARVMGRPALDAFIWGAVAAAAVVPHAAALAAATLVLFGLLWKHRSQRQVEPEGVQAGRMEARTSIDS
jgi:TRAP transporter 4TM/12TM fusion protein